jgi:tetratricopeptide (TPR) repeat protein
MPPPKTKNDTLLKALRLDALGREAKAIPFYEAALFSEKLTEKERRLAMISLGSSYRNVGRYSEAVKILTCVCDKFPKNIAARLFLALALLSDNKPTQGLQLLSQYLLDTNHNSEFLIYKKPLQRYIRAIAKEKDKS